MKIVNLTHRELNIRDEDMEIRSFPATGKVAR